MNLVSYSGSIKKNTVVDSNALQGFDLDIQDCSQFHVDCLIFLQIACAILLIMLKSHNNHTHSGFMFFFCQV